MARFGIVLDSSSSYRGKDIVMYSKMGKGIQSVSVVFLMLLLSGCGAKFTFHDEIVLAENATLPGIPELGMEVTVPNLLSLDSGQILLGEACGLSEIEDLLDNNSISTILPDQADLPLYGRFLMRSVKVESLILKNITLRAHEGDFSFLNQLGFEIRSKTTGRSILAGQAQGVFGQEVVLAFEDDTDLLDMSDELEGTDCIESYLDLGGAVPTQNVSFDAVLQFEIELRIGWVL